MNPQQTVPGSQSTPSVPLNTSSEVLDTSSSLEMPASPLQAAGLPTSPEAAKENLSTKPASHSTNRSLYANEGKYSFVGQAPQRRLALIFIAVLGVLLALAGAAAFFQTKRGAPESPVAMEQELTSIPSTDLSVVDAPDLSDAGRIQINGPLEIKSQFVLSPSDRPDDAQTGQIYFDSSDKTFVYFDGQDYRTITTADEVLQSRQAISGELSASITEQNAHIDNVVRSLQSSTGAVNLSAGSGIGISGLQISNAGVTQLQGTPNQVFVSASTGSVQISLPQNIHSGATPTFSGINLTNLQVSGQSALQGVQANQLTLTQALDITSGGIGSDGTGLATHGVLYFDGTRFATTPTASAPNLCLVSTASAPVFASCDSAMGDAVNSLNGLQGDLTIADSTASGSTITINTATQSQSGILSTVSQRIGGLKTFTGGISFSFGSNITSENNLSIQPAQHRDLILGTSGTGRLIVSALDCSTHANGGKLTIDSNGVVLCAEDTGGDGVGLGSISAADNSIYVNNTDGNNPQVSVNNRANGGLSTTAGGLGLVDTCGDDQVLKYTSATGWACADDEGTNDGGGCPTCVALQSSTPGTAQTGHINVTGSIIGGSASFAGSVKIQTPMEATDAFQLQNAAGASLITGNTQNMNVTIGSLAAPTSSEISGELPSGSSKYVSLGSQAPVATAVSDDYAYVITSSSWLYVLDVSDRNASPSIAFGQNMGAGTITSPVDIVINGNYMYILDEPNTSLSYIRVFNISNPTNPTLVTSVTSGRYPVSLAMNGSNLYMVSNESGSFGNDHLYVYDLTDPALPVQSGDQTIGSISTWPTSVTIKGTTLFVTDRGLNQVMAFNVSDPANITELGTVNTATAPIDISIYGNYAYIINNSAGNMQTIDITDPANMQVTHTTDPGEIHSLPTAIQASAGYVMLTTYYDSGDTTHGFLQLYNASNPAVPSLVGSTDLIARGAAMTLHDGVAYVAGIKSLANNIQTFKFGDGATTLKVYGSSSMTGSLSLGGDLTAQNGVFGGSVSASNLQSLGYVRAQDFDALTLNSTLNIGATYANAINLNQNTTIGLGKSLTVQGSTTVTTDSTAALRVADSSNNAYLLVDTSGKNIDIGSTSAPTENSNVGGSLPSGAAGNVNISSLPNSVAISGGYAYVASSTMNNLQIVNISNPTNPTTAGSIATSGAAQDVAVEGTRAYVAVGTNTVQVFDVSNPAAPLLLGSTTTRNASTSIQSIAVKDNFLYIAHIGAAANYYGYMDTFDMTNPAAPVAQGTSAKTLGSATEEIRMDIEGNRLYVISKGLTTNSGLRIIDISNPAVASLPMTNHNMLSTSPSGGIAVHDGYAFIPFSNSSLLQVYNVSAIGGSGVLTPVGSTSIGNSPADAAMSESGDYLYIVDEGTNVLQVFNVTDPLSPQAIGTVDTSSGNSSAKTVSVASATNGTVAVVNNSRSNLVTVDLAGTTPRISLNQNTILSTGRTFTTQGNTTIRTDSAVAFTVQNAAGNNVLTVNTNTGVITALNGFGAGGFTGITASCSSDQTLTNIVIVGGIVTSGICGDGEGDGGGSGAIVATDGVQTPSVDTIALGGTLQLGSTNASGISLNQDTAIASGKSLSVQGDTSIATTSETALNVSDADSNQYLLVDTQNGMVTIGAPVIEEPDGGGDTGSDLIMPEAYTSRTSVGGQPYDVLSHGNYVFVSLNFDNKVNVYDVSNPTAPSLATSVTVTKPEKMAISGDYLYVLTDTQIYVINIASPASASLAFTTNAFGLFGNYEALATNATTLYILTDQRQLLSFNITNPLATGLLSSRSSAIGLSPPAYDVENSGSHFFVSDGASTANILRSYTGTNSINQVGFANTATKPTGLAIHGNFAYVISSANNNAPGKMEIFDISTPTAPTKRSEVATGNWPLDIAISDDGKFASILNYNSTTFQAVDIADPDNPISVGSVATGAGPLAIDASTNYAYVISMSGQYLEIYTVEADTSEPEEPEPTFGITLNSNTVMTSGNVMQLQGETSIKTDSEKAFRIQNTAGDTLLTADTMNGTLTVNGSITVAVDSATALDIQDANGDSFLTVDTTTRTLTVAGDGIFEGNLTVAGHFITGGDTPTTTIQAAAGTGASCTISGNDSSGTITITAGNDSFSAGAICVITFSEAFDSAPRPVLSSADEDSAQMTPYVHATTSEMTLGFTNAPTASQEYQFNYWAPQ